MDRVGQEFSKGALKTRLFTAREGFLSKKVEVPLHDIYDRQTGVGPADVTDKNRSSFPSTHLQHLPKVSVIS
jgi:hypothetical protein